MPFVLLIAMRGYVLLRERRLAAVLLVLAIPFGLARIGVAERRSTNAAAAALWMVDSRSPSVALSQPWAYGGRLFLGNDVEIADIDIPPNLERVRETSRATAVVAVYSADVNEALRTACREAELSETKTFTGHGGRDVTVFHRYTFSSVKHP